MGLDIEFSVIKIQILATKSIPTLGMAYQMVDEDERHKAISNESINPRKFTAFKAFQRRNGLSGLNKERSGAKVVKEGIE